MYECGTKDHVAAVLQCTDYVSFVTIQKYADKIFLSEMQHGGESSSTLPATASLNLAMRRARLRYRQTGSRIATADLRKFKSKEEFLRRSEDPFSKHSIGPRNTLSQSREAREKLMSVYGKLCCLTRGGS